MQNSYKPPGHRIVTVPIDPELHRRLRVAAAAKDLTIKQFVTACIVQALEDNN